MTRTSFGPELSKAGERDGTSFSLSFCRRFPRSFPRLINKQTSEQKKTIEQTIEQTNKQLHLTCRLQELQNWLKEIPCHGIEQTPCGTERLDEGIIRAIENQVNVLAVVINFVVVGVVDADDDDLIE